MMARFVHPGSPYSGEMARAKRARAVVLGAALSMACAQPAAILFTYGLFAPVIAADEGWSPAAVAAAIGPAILVGALLAPVCGRAADAFGAQRVALVGGPAYALGFILLALVPTRLWQFTAMLALLCGLGFAATPILYAKIVTGWFVRRRGLALSLVFASTSLGMAAWPPLAARLVESLGWRSAYLAIGSIAGTIITFSSLFLLREPAASAGGVGAAASGAGISFRQASRSRTFWALAGCFGLLTTVLFGSSVHLPTLLRLTGASPTDAASALTATGLAAFVGRLSTGVMLDRWPASRLIAGVLLVALLAVAMLGVDGRPMTILACAILLGLCLGAELDIAAYITAQAFGQRSYGTIFGAVTLAFGIASAVGPAMVGYALVGGTPPAHLAIAAGVMLFAAAALIRIIHPSSLRPSGSINR